MSVISLYEDFVILDGCRAWNEKTQSARHQQPKTLAMTLNVSPIRMWRKQENVYDGTKVESYHLRE
jgi:hypothetical protein